jgi:hypothetical protein
MSQKWLFAVVVLFLVGPVFADSSESASPVPSSSHSESLYDGTLSVFLGQRLGGKEWKSGLYGEVDYLKPIDSFSSVGVGVGYTVADNKEEFLLPGEISMIPLLLKFRATTYPSRSVVFLEAGLGQYLINRQMSAEAKAILRSMGFEVTEKLENTFGGFFGLGVIFHRTPEAALGLSFQRHFVKPNFKGKAQYIPTGETLIVEDRLDLSSTIFSFNAVRHF